MLVPDGFATTAQAYWRFIGDTGLADLIGAELAGLDTDRAIAYRVHHGFAHEQVALSAGVQQMVRSDVGHPG